MRLVPAMLALALVALSCSPSAWEVQARSASVVQQAADLVALPALEAAEREAGLLAIKGATTRAEAEAALERVRLHYRPAWRAWDAFQAAHGAWLVAIETRGDPLPSAAAARIAFCRLRVEAKAVGVRLPDFPIARCT